MVRVLFYLAFVCAIITKLCFVNLQSIQEKILPIIFHAVRSTKHLVDWVLPDYIDYYMQGSGKSDKYGFIFVACLSEFQ